MRFDQATAVVTGIGGCLPDRVLSNQDVIAAGALGTSDDWIRTRTGIARRRHVDPCTSTGDLAVAAGRAALESARASGDAAEYRDPDLLVLATSTPDHPCPATAPDVAHRMGLGTVPAFDLAAVCSGFLYALTTATALLRSGACRAPLVIAAETYSTILDPQDRETAPIFGDGAAAVLLRLGPPDHPGAVLAADLGADGSGHQLITIPAGGSRLPAHRPGADPTDTYFRMQGREVYAHAVRRMTQSARRALEQARWTPTAVDAFIGHQANQRILDSVAERLGLPATRCFGNIHELGNTAAASIPLVMADAAVQSALAPGARTLLTAFGGGLTWASVALTWPAAPVRWRPPQPPPPHQSATRPPGSPAWTRTPSSSSS
ncbi:beta-ketoacyl-ACP synthase III [Streptacidiphilus albus]|uniref:beta-ketoacyl-ACP synthase III n=1 Tax=Streptacidiphilus albus TaxID=105425 RepID=UPI00054BFF71|nr:beta-ketoacyl-ACP synthase III [Streptacidiphilus albus]